MKKRTKRRFNSTNQIRDEIDRWKAKAGAYNASADMLEIKAADLYKQGPEWTEEANYAKEMAKKKRASAGRIESRKLVKLKEKMAEFNTNLLPGIIADNERSVSAT